MVDSDVKRGVSFLTGIAKYIVKYEGWLEDRITLNKIRHFFNIVGEPIGNSSTADLAGKFTDVEGKTAVAGTPKKKMPKPGTVLLTKGVKWDLKSLNINATDTKEDGRSIELQVCKGTHFAEYVVRGDASNANYSSSMVSESPMVKAFESWQDFFEKPFKKLVKEELEYGLAEHHVPARSKETVTVNRKEKKDAEGNITEPAGTKQIKKAVDTKTTCIINFALLIHRDIKEETESLVMHSEKGWASDETCSTKLGYEFEKEKNKIDQEDEEKEAKQKTAFDMQNNDPNNPGAFPGQDGQDEPGE